MRFHRVSLLAAVCLPLLGVSSAFADGLFSSVATVHVTVTQPETQAQLADHLRAEGYSDVIMSSATASPANPHPEKNSSLTSNPGQTLVHAGWNGVAVKDGQTIQVYAEF